MLQGQHKPVRPWPPRGRRQWVVFLGHTLLVAAIVGLLLVAAMLAGCATVTKPSPVEAAAAAGGKAQVSGENAIELHGLLGQYVQPTGRALWEGLGRVMAAWTRADGEQKAAMGKLAAENTALKQENGELKASDPLKTTFRWAALLFLFGGGIVAIIEWKVSGKILGIGAATVGLGLMAGGLYYFGKTLMVLTIGGVGAVLLYGLILMAITIAHQMKSHNMSVVEAIKASLGREAIQ